MDNLVSILRKEIEIYTAELEIVKKKIKAIENDDIVELENLVKAEEKTIIDIKKCEAEREKVLKEKNFSSLKECIENIGNYDKKTELQNIRVELLDILDKIKFGNTTAEQLVNISTGIINNVIRTITGNKEIGYKKDKQKHEVTQNSFLNKKI